jgi:N4-gp56 family major capsid protein
MAVISIGSLSDVEKTFYFKEALAFAKPALIYQQFGQKDRISAREGKIAQWIRFTKLSLSSGTDFAGSATYVKNTTGAAPTWTPATPADTTYTAQMDCLFGIGHEWNEAVQYTALVDLPKELRKLNAQHAAEAIDKEVRDVVIGGSNIVYADGVAGRSSLATDDYIDMVDIFTAVTNLRNYDAPTINGMYSALCSHNVIMELMRDTTFQSAVQFQKDYIFTGTIAELYGVRFLTTSLAPTVANSGTSGSSTIEQTMVVGDGAFGVTHWLLGDYDIIYTTPGGHGDEWATKHKLTWKMYEKAVILNQNWLVRVESVRRA